MNQRIATKEQHWVYQSIANWANFSMDRTAIKVVAEKDFNVFHYLRGDLLTDNIHAYFGYYNERLYLHFIPSSVDVSTSFQDPTTIPTALYSSIGIKENASKGPIEKSDAEIRISKWEDQEVRNKVIDNASFVQVFWIPNDDFKGNSPLKINLAIHNDQVDLVLTSMGKSSSYLDTCKPIPPFDSTLTQQKFGLLQQLKIWKNK